MFGAYDIITYIITAAIPATSLLYKLYMVCNEIYGGVWGGKRNKGLDFGNNPDHHADCAVWNRNVRYLAITQQIMDFGDFFSIALQFYTKQLIKFLRCPSSNLDHHADCSI